MSGIAISLGASITAKVLRASEEPRVWRIDTIAAKERPSVYPVGNRNTGKAAERREAKRRRRARK